MANNKKSAARKAASEPSTAQQMADDIERFVTLGERVIRAAGGVNALMSSGLDKLLAPSLRRALEKKIESLEQENRYMREVLVALTDTGPLYIDRPKEKSLLSIEVDVRNNTIDVRRLEN